jgi:transcriptional regulator with XRE-family HTH domain
MAIRAAAHAAATDPLLHRMVSAGEALPEEVLALPPGDGDAGRAALFIERMDEWRRAMAWTHTAFAARLGLAESYWRALRRGAKPLTLSVALRVLEERPELVLLLGDPYRYFGERRRRRAKRSGGGAKALDGPPAAM